MRYTHAVAMGALLASLGGCFVPRAHGGAAQTPFVQSSLDGHGGKLHLATLSTVPPARAIDLLTRVAKERGLLLVDGADSCVSGCKLSYRSKPVDKRVFRASGSLRRSYYSRYFLSLAPLAGGTRVMAVGVPVFDGEMSCPPKVRARLACKPVKLPHPRGTTLAASVRKTWGYDVSGRNEADTLAGWLAELSRAKSPPAAAGLAKAGAAKSPAPIVAVFDLDDRAKVSTRELREQLGVYLAAAVTRHAGFKTVPRSQLRARLRREKRKSYRACFDQSCQIAIGKALAAQKSLAPRLIKIGKQCALTASLYDLRSEAAERAASVKTACTPEALLDAMERVAKQLAR
jgi:hypothetical protein